MAVVRAGNDHLLGKIDYYQERLETARKHGFDDVITFLIEAYAQTGSTAYIANLIGMSKFGTRYLMKKIIKLNGPGGDNKWLWRF